MSATTLAGLALAGAASVGLAAGPLLQHEGLASAPALAGRGRLGALRILLGSRRWVRGAALGYGGLVLQLAAMVLVPLWMVQSVLAAGLVAVVLRWGHQRGRPPSRRERASLVLLGLALLALAPAGAGARPGVAAGAPALALAGAVAILLALAVLRASRPADHAGRLALAAGVLYAATTIALAGVLGVVTGGDGGPAVLGAGTLVGGLTAVAGFALFQRALQTAPPARAITLMAAAMNGLAVTGGILLAGGPAPPAPVRAAQLAGLGTLAAAAVLAARGRPAAVSAAR